MNAQSYGRHLSSTATGAQAEMRVDGCRTYSNTRTSLSLVRVQGTEHSSCCNALGQHSRTRPVDYSLLLNSEIAETFLPLSPPLSAGLLMLPIVTL
jgi:hypothetical protein